MSDLAYWGVDCALYCPAVCRFVFYNDSDCKLGNYSYEVHGEPMGNIRATDRFDKNMQYRWNNVQPKWKAVHINNAKCKIALYADGAEQAFTGAGCKAIQEKFELVENVSSTMQCLQEEDFYQATNQENPQIPEAFKKFAGYIG